MLVGCCLRFARDCDVYNKLLGCYLLFSFFKRTHNYKIYRSVVPSLPYNDRFGVNKIWSA